MHYPPQCWGNRVRILSAPWATHLTDLASFRPGRNTVLEKWGSGWLFRNDTQQPLTYTYTCAHTLTHSYTHIHTFVCTHIHIHTWTNTFIHTHSHMHTSITHPHTHLQSHMHVHSNTCTYSHIYTPVYPHTCSCPVTNIHACLETRGTGRLGLSTSPLWGLLVGTCPLWVHSAFVLWVCFPHFPVNPRSLYGYPPVKLD